MISEIFGCIESGNFKSIQRAELYRFEEDVKMKLLLYWYNDLP